uniref:Reverse transcriptase domain-containing protein n=1 Tax=Tanacetum cinerariifolium TaxID=118510 RepID=A0A6L2N356_TANCI|nr:reverse transcriptase domain-containing protein [Tanacetum cinerariifolium]
MADNRTMEEMLQAPTEGYGDAIVTTHLKNEITRFTQKFEETFGEAQERFKEMLRQCPHHGFLELHQIDTFYNSLNEHEQDSLNAAAGVNLLSRTPRDALTITKNKSKVRYSRNKPVASKNMLACLMNNPSGSGSLPSNTIANPKGDLKGITTQSGVCYDEPAIPPPFSYLPKVVGRVPEVTKDTVQPSTKNIQPSVVQTQVPPDEPVVAPNPKPTIPYPSRANKQKLHEKDDNLALKFKKLSLPELTATRMILELADRSMTRPADIAEDVFVKVGKFHFPTDFVVVDYVVDPRVPLILGRPFLRIGRALIDVYGEELTLCVDDEAITFKVGQTSKYSYNDAESINLIDVIDVAYEDFEEIEACLTRKSIPPGIDDTNFDLEGGIRLIEKLLNDDPFLSPLPSIKLNVEEIKIVKSSIDEPPELDPKELPSHLEYAFLVGTDKLPIIISKELKDEEKSTLLRFVSPVHCVPKMGGMTVIENEDNELIPTRLVAGWRVCIDYRKLNDATQKDHFSLPFMDKMLEHLARNEFYCFLDGFSRYFQIPIDPQDQEKSTFTCPYGTFAYRRITFGLYNAPITFQRCMMAVFHYTIEETMEVFMDDYLVFKDSFSSCLSYLDKMLERCEDTNLVLNWEKCHFMVKEGIVLDHKNSKLGIEVERAKVDVIAKLPHPTFVKGV